MDQRFVYQFCNFCIDSLNSKTVLNKTVNVTMSKTSCNCNRNRRNIILAAIASCCITGFIYQLLFHTMDTNTQQNVEINAYQARFVQNKAIYQIHQNLPPPFPTLPVLQQSHTDGALESLAKYSSEVQLNKHKYANTDFSFFWTQGDGSPLFINATKHPRHKFKNLVFCPVPKVGCSSWKQVIKRIKGSPIYLADDYWSLHDPLENELDEDRIHKLGLSGANKLLFNENEQPFHAIFVRDPITRALSAFLDKCVNAGWTGKYWCEPTTVLHVATLKPFHAYSQFDLFIENIINKPILRNNSEYQDLPHMQIWAIDFHWLPQNFMCDAYKFIDRYHVYKAENISHRKQFLTDIGGEQLWKEVGSHGWITRGKRTEDVMVQLHFGPDNNRQKKPIPGPSYFKGVHEYYHMISKDYRPHKPIINLPGHVNEVNVSLMETVTFHASKANDKLYKYYRSDILAKAIAYYEDDYVLFKQNIPNIVCDYLKYDELDKLMDSVIAYYQTGKNDGNLETAESIYHGKFSIFTDDDIDYRGSKVIDTVEDLNQSIPLKWDRNKWIFDTNQDTKIPYFYEMKDFDDEYENQMFGVSLSGLRGMVTLINIISIIDPRTWPKQQKCFNLDNDNGDIKDISRKELSHITGLLYKYLYRLLPVVLNKLSNDDNGIKKKEISNKIEKWTDTTDIGKLDIPKLIIKWIEQDKKMYANIRSWFLYHRDVPRNMFWEFRNYDEMQKQQIFKARQAHRVQPNH